MIACGIIFPMKRALASLISTCLIAGLVVAGDYVIKNVVVRPIETYPLRMSLDNITIAAEPYLTDEQSFTAFDVKDLNSRGYFPIHVIIQNSSRHYLALSTRNIVLEWESGLQLYTTPATLVVQDVVKGSLLARLPRIQSNDRAASARKGSPLADFTAKELTNRGIEAGTVSHGFLFFYSRALKKDQFSGARLVIPTISLEDAQQQLGPFRIPLNPPLRQDD